MCRHQLLLTYKDKFLLYLGFLNDVQEMVLLELRISTWWHIDSNTQTKSWSTTGITIETLASPGPATAPSSTSVLIGTRINTKPVISSVRCINECYIDKTQPRNVS